MWKTGRENVWLSGLFCAIIRANLLTFHFILGKFGVNNRVVWLSMVWLSGLCCTSLQRMMTCGHTQSILPNRIPCYVWIKEGTDLCVTSGCWAKWEMRSSAPSSSELNPRKDGAERARKKSYVQFMTAFLMSKIHEPACGMKYRGQTIQRNGPSS